MTGARVVAAAAVLVALVAFALVRVQVVDVPWHLATARLARALGHWPTTNTFSYTFPDHPLYQQYPAFQAVLYAVFQRAGWDGLSLLSCAGWVAAFLLFVRWAGPLRAALPFHLAWMLGLYALQRRMILRPDLFTMLALGGILLALQGYTRGRRWAIALVPLVHLFWVNSHQLFPVSLLVQGLFVAHLLLARWGRLGVDTADARVPVVPPLAALAASAALCLATPLGAHIVEVMTHTAGSLSRMRDQVSEFARIWQLPHEAALAVLTGAPAAWALWRARRRWSPLDVGLWLLAMALALSAVRGLMFFGIVSVAVTQRTLLRLRAAGEPWLPASAVRLPLARLAARGALALTLVLGANVVFHRWVRPPLALGGTQPGIGRSAGGWGDASLAFLRASPPPGHMLNMGWPSGNQLIWGLPEQPVFVDPRFESYPHDFLRAAADACADDAKLAALIAAHQPGWIYAEHFRPPVRARVVTLLRAGWTPVHVDSDHIVLVRGGAATAGYRAAHAIDLGRAEPGDLLPGPPALRAQQRARFARLMRALGFEARVAEQRAAAVREAGPDAAAATFDEPAPPASAPENHSAQ